MANTSWETVGKCHVDSGLLMLMDPFFVIPPRLWTRFLKKMRKNEIANAADMGLGTIVHTAHGDGVYPVKARYNDSGDIVEIRVEFD